MTDTPNKPNPAEKLRGLFSSPDDLNGWRWSSTSAPGDEPSLLDRARRIADFYSYGKDDTEKELTGAKAATAKASGNLSRWFWPLPQPPQSLRGSSGSQTLLRPSTIGEAVWLATDQAPATGS
jgi:hypothetical protein